MSGVLGFVRKLARIVRPFRVENGRFVRRSSSFRQEFLELRSHSNRAVKFDHTGCCVRVAVYKSRNQKEVPATKEH
jgi:hypothetical protein